MPLTNQNLLSAGLKAIGSVIAIVAFLYVSFSSDTLHVLFANMPPVGLSFVTLAVLYAVYSNMREAPRIQLNSGGRVFAGGFGAYAAITLAVCISMLPILVSWSTASQFYSTIGGLIPWSDAVGYYSGAEHLLRFGQLDTWGQRRPLNDVFFASRLALTGDDFRYALLLQAAFFGGTALYAASAVARTHGKSAGFLLFALLLAFAAKYLPTTLSESLGITLGSLAFAMLWNAVSEKRQAIFYVGLGFLTLALLARAGAMLVLPAMVLYAGVIFRRHDGRYGWRSLAAALIAVFIAVMANKSLLYFYGDGSEVALGNFSYTLYGLAVGGKGWTQIFTDYPEVNTLPANMVSQFIYAKAFSTILHAPQVFILTILKGLLHDPIVCFVQVIKLIIFNNVPSDPDVTYAFRTPVYLVVSILLVIGTIKFCKRHVNTESTRHIFIGLFSMMVSLPFFYTDGGVRLIAATFPYIAALGVISLLGWMPKINSTASVSENAYSATSGHTWGLVVCIVGVLGLMVLPGMVASGEKGRSHAISCAPNETLLYVRLDRGIPFVRLSDALGDKISFSPDISFRDFSVSPLNEGINNFSLLTPKSILMLPFDELSGKIRWGVVPIDYMDKFSGKRFICASPFSQKDGYVIWDMHNLLIRNAGH